MATFLSTNFRVSSSVDISPFPCFVFVLIFLPIFLPNFYTGILDLFLVSLDSLCSPRPGPQFQGPSTVTRSR